MWLRDRKKKMTETFLDGYKISPQNWAADDVLSQASMYISEDMRQEIFCVPAQKLKIALPFAVPCLYAPSFADGVQYIHACPL